MAILFSIWPPVRRPDECSVPAARATPGAKFSPGAASDRPPRFPSLTNSRGMGNFLARRPKGRKVCHSEPSEESTFSRPAESHWRTDSPSAELRFAQNNRSEPGPDFAPFASPRLICLTAQLQAASGQVSVNARSTCTLRGWPPAIPASRCNTSGAGVSRM
jgi:hypothetical protein